MAAVTAVSNTQRKVQDCCAILHNSMGKWKKLTDESFDMICDLLKTDKESCKDPGSQRQPRNNELLINTMTKMDNVITDMKNVLHSFTNTHQLLFITGKHNQPLFKFLKFGEYVSRADDIFRAYSEELSIRRALLSDIWSADKDLQTVYLSLWLHQVMSHDVTDKLESLLIDCGHRDIA